MHTKRFSTWPQCVMKCLQIPVQLVSVLPKIDHRTFFPTLSVQQQIICSDNLPLWHSYTYTIHPGIFRSLGVWGGLFSHVTWRPSTSKCPLWHHMKPSMKQNVDILSYVTWVFLEVFKLSWHWVDKKSQYCGYLSIIIPTSMKCHLTPTALYDEERLDDKYCSWSRRRPQKVDKRMVLEHTHGLFIT